MGAHCDQILGATTVMLLDDPTERLMLLAKEIAAVIVEQHLDLALRVATQAYVLDRDTVAMVAGSAVIRDDPRLFQFLAP